MHPITIFYVYSETDETLRQQLEKHLALLRRQGVIAGWEPILAGAPWAEKTEQVFNEAKLILLLVSADFLNSDVCYELHMQRALERERQGEVKVIPILLRPVDWKSAPFAHLQVLPKNEKPITSWSNREEAFKEVAEGIRCVIEGDTLEKKNNSVKYYIYGSDTKVDMLYSQIPTNIRRKLASELNIDLEFIDVETSGAIKKVETNKTRYAKIQLATKYIENNFDVGTIEKPGTYFKGTLSMKWGPLTTDKNVVYFGGLTDRTVVGLGGSMYHIIGRNQGKSFNPPSMSPLHFLWDALRIAEEDTFQNDPDQAVNPKLFAHPIDLVAHLTLNMNGPCQQLEFLAKTLLQGPLTKQAYLSTGNLSSIIFGSPIYVADDIH